MITELTRMWLTRSTKPFLFKNEYDQELPFSDCDGLGLYVHIPFCGASAASVPTARPSTPRKHAAGTSTP